MREFYITDDGIRLHAKLDMPAGKVEGDACPLVILIHGFTGHMEERHIIAVQEAINESGFACLRAEMYGHGSSEGEFRNHTLYKWVANALAVVEYAKSLDWVTDLFLSGHSQGGLLTTLIAGMRPDDFKAIMPLSPACMIPQTCREGEFLGNAFDPQHLPEEIWIESKESPLSGNYLRVAQTIHYEDEVRRYHGPVLIVHGDADEAVPYAVGQEVAAMYDNAELVTIPGDDHCYDYHLELVVEAVKEYLKKFV